MSNFSTKFIVSLNGWEGGENVKTKEKKKKLKRNLASESLYDIFFSVNFEKAIIYRELRKSTLTHSHSPKVEVEANIKIMRCSTSSHGANVRSFTHTHSQTHTVCATTAIKIFKCRLEIYCTKRKQTTKPFSFVSIEYFFWHLGFFRLAKWGQVCEFVNCDNDKLAFHLDQSTRKKK